MVSAKFESKESYELAYKRMFFYFCLILDIMNIIG